MNKIVIFLLLIAGFQLTACNTVKGVGSDIKATGEAISKSADETRKKM
ncbi:MAG: entericidin A/B family lipoprotein [Gammaproteobacteria bacterium]|nr:entericidin A/B family lipoprotein [Gammaproteobacteria bacterium]